MDPGKAILGVTAGAVVLSVVVLAVVLAGALGGVFGGDPVPENVSEVESDDLPDGVEKGVGVTNASAVALSHDDSLSSTSYTATLRLDRTVRGEGRPRPDVVQRSRVGSDGQFLLTLVQRRGRTEVRRLVWGNDSVAVTRVEGPGDPRVERLDPDDAREARGNLSAHLLVEDVLAAGQFRLVGVEKRNGKALLTMAADTPSEDAAAVMGKRSVTAYNGTVTLTEDGRVYAVDVRMNYTTSDGSNVTAHFEYELTKVGSTTVSRPDWVAEGLSLVAPGPAADRGAPGVGHRHAAG